jgi:RNA polymerase sigma-70 factor, ECF subfamily
MTGPDELFAAERPRLVGLAYRLLGSLADAEDTVQEAWIRWSRADHASIERPAAWLTTVVSRLGLDRLRARQRERTDYVGPWLPEPLVEPLSIDGPERAAVLGDSLTTAFLTMLEDLTPEERLVVLLVDVFDEPFRSVAGMLDRSEEACRQLAVRARRKLRARPERRAAAKAEQLALASTFIGAVLSGDIDLVTSMLAPDAVLTSDGGPNRHAARRPVVGPERIARFVVNIGQRVDDSVTMEPVWVNGSPGALLCSDGMPWLVTLVDVVDERVERCYLILNPDKLTSIGRTVELI